MKNPLIITIGREYGSGGRQIGKALAERLGISYYDKEIITLAAKKSGLAEEFIAGNEQRVRSGLMHNFSATASYHNGFFANHYLPLSENIFIAQAQAIRDIAAKESAVIVGRCADYILEGRENTINVFIHAPMDARIKRIMELHNMTRLRRSRRSPARTRSAATTTSAIRILSGARRRTTMSPSIPR